MIFGADGVYSAIRGAMQHNKGFNFSQEYLDHGYKELLLQQDPDFSKETNQDPKKEGHLMDSHSLHIWPRGLFMLMGLPNLDHTYTITLFLPHSKFDQLEQGSDRDVIQFFEQEFPDFLALIGPDRLLKQFRTNPVGHLLTVQTAPFYKNKSVIVGDAAHGIVPFYGQGMNAGMEDVRILLQIMDKNNLSPKTIQNEISSSKNFSIVDIFEEYYQKRKANVDTIAKLSRGNYDEMRDHVNHSDYKFRKMLDDYLFHFTSFLYWRGKPSREIWELSDEKLKDWVAQVWIPQYSMVSFSNIPYAKLMEKAKEQDRKVNDVIGFLKASGKFVGVIGVVGVAMMVITRFFPPTDSVQGRRPNGGRPGSL